MGAHFRPHTPLGLTKLKADPHKVLDKTDTENQ